MTPQQLHEALGLLDDDLIEAADVCRRCAPAPRGYVKYWFSAAACLAVLVVSLWLWRSSPWRGDVPDKAGSPATDCVNVGDVPNHIPDEAQPPKGADTDGITLTPPGSAPEQLQTMSLTILRWEENGFAAERRGDGMRVWVDCTETLRTEFSDQRPGYDGAPCRDQFPTGSRVQIEYVPLAPMDGGEMLVITPKVIRLLDTKEE